MHGQPVRIFSFSLALLFVLMIGTEFSHAFDHHKDHCHHEGEVHLHEFEPDCSLCYLNFYKTPGIISEVFRLAPSSDAKELPGRKPCVLYHSRHTLKSPRSPPVC
jgi:hypothetical protein